MSEWQTEPPEVRQFAAIRLIRVPVAGAVTGVITSPGLLGRYTHWDKYRTQPCPGLEPPHPCPADWRPCELCRNGMPRRWHAWISMYLQISAKQIVLQLPALAATALKDARAQHGFLRGLLAGFSRTARKPNARIIVETRQLPQPLANLPPPVQIPEYMALIWQTKADMEDAAGNNGNPKSALPAITAQSPAADLADKWQSRLAALQSATASTPQAAPSPH